MKSDMLKVGTDKGEFFVKAEIQVPETIVDVFQSAKASQAVISAASDLLEVIIAEKDIVSHDYVVAKFTRGYRIDLQEGGARQAMIELQGTRSAKLCMSDKELLAKAQKEVEAEIKSFDPAKPRARAGRQAAPPQKVVVNGEKQYSAEEVRAMLAGLKGVVVLDA